MALRRLATVAVVAGATLGWPAVCEGAANGTLAFEVVTPVETCDQCGPNGESELFGGGSRIWLRYLRGTNGLWVGDPDGRSKVRISRTGRYLSWSPDGSRIAFLTSGALMVIDADGKRRRALTKKCGIGYEDEGGVAWSPDGREIACRSRAGSLVVLNLVTMTLRKVVSWPRFTQGSVGEISWQPVPAR